MTTVSHVMAGLVPMRIRIAAWEQNALFGGTVPGTSWPGVFWPSVAAPVLVGMAGTRPICIRIRAGREHHTRPPLAGGGWGEGWHQHRSRSRHKWQARL